MRTLRPLCCLPRCLLRKRTLYHAHNRPHSQSNPALDMDKRPIEINPQLCPTAHYIREICLNVALLAAVVANTTGGTCHARGRRSCPLRRRARKAPCFLGSLQISAGTPRLFPACLWAPQRGQMGCNNQPRPLSSGLPDATRLGITPRSGDPLCP